MRWRTHLRHVLAFGAGARNRQVARVSALSRLVGKATKDAGGLRPLARQTGLCPGYLCRLKNGEKINPSDETLALLGIERVVTYRPARTDGGSGNG